jgi:hypothetical protein
MGNSSNESDDSQLLQTKFEKLNQHNWATWRPRFKNIVTAKGYETIMNIEWVQANKRTPKFQQMSAWAMNKLYTVVKSKLHPVLTLHEGDIYGAFKALSAACGKKSVLQLCDKLYALINMSYTLETSMSQHLSEFRKNYTLLTTTIEENPDFMSMSTGLAAALLLRSFNQDESLTSLIQSLYDLQPLTFEKVYDRLLLKDTQKNSKETKNAFHVNQSKRQGKLPSGPSRLSSTTWGFSSFHRNHRGGSSTQNNFRGVKPTRSAPNKQDDMLEQFSKMFNAHWSKYMAGQANLADDDDK